MLVREPVVVLVGLVVPGFVLAVALLVVLALESPELLLLVLAAGVSLACCGWRSPWQDSTAGCCGISSSAGLVDWLGSCPTAGAASFPGLDSSVSIGSSATVATPSGFIFPQVVVVRLCRARLMDSSVAGRSNDCRHSGDGKVGSVSEGGGGGGGG